MRKAVAVLGLLLLCSCATPVDTRPAQFQQYMAQLDAERSAGRINSLQRSRALSEAYGRLWGHNVGSQEYWAYHAYLAVEIDAGRMSREQAAYLLAQKEAEIQQRLAAILLPFAMQQQAIQAQRNNEFWNRRRQPVVIPQQTAPRQTACHRVGEYVYCNHN